MLICSSCRSEQTNGTLFCSECGSDLTIPAAPTFVFDKDNFPLPDQAPWQPTGFNSASVNPTLAPNLARLSYDIPAEIAVPSSSNPATYYEEDEFYQDRKLQSPPGLPAPSYSKSPSYNSNSPLSNYSNYMMPLKSGKHLGKGKQPIRDDLRLIVLNTGRLLYCPESDSVIIGRYDALCGEKPDIDLANDNAVELGVSRRHACITFQDNEPYITDLGAKNYTFLNRNQLIKGESKPLQNGDEIRLGNIILKVLYDPQGLI